MADGKSVMQNLGPVTAYAIARKHGFSGTEEEWAKVQMQAVEAGESAIKASIQAAGDARSASASASAAAGSERRTEEQVGVAKQHADNAETNAERAASEAVKSSNQADRAEAAKQGIEDALAAADQSASAAAQSESNALTHETAARGESEEAKTAARAAAKDAQTASASAASAAKDAKATAADRQATKADAAATAADRQAVATDKANAQSAAETAQQAAATATQKAETATQQVTKATQQADRAKSEADRAAGAVEAGLTDVRTDISELSSKKVSISDLDAATSDMTQPVGWDGAKKKLVTKKSGGITVGPAPADPPAEDTANIDPDVTAVEVPTQAEFEQAIGELNAKKADIAYVNQTFANALKGNVSGSVVAVDDVSPAEHQVACKVEGKNLIPFPYEFNSGNYSGVEVTVLSDGGVRLEGTCTGRKAYLNFWTKDLGRSMTVRAPYNDEYVLSGFLRNLLSYDGNSHITFLVLNPGDIFNDTIYPQIERGAVATPYTPYVPPETVTVTQKRPDGSDSKTFKPDADGVVTGMTSLSPAMTILTDNPGVTVNAEYNRDINKAFAKLEAAILSTGGNV